MAFDAPGAARGVAVVAEPAGSAPAAAIYPTGGHR